MFETSNCGRERRFISTSSTITGSLGTYLARIKLPLRNCLKTKGNFSRYTDSADFARMKRLSLKTKKINGIQKIDLNKKKSIDYTEMAYREAVSKLKYLLAESYVSKPTLGKAQGIKDSYRFSNTKINEAEEERDDRSVEIDNSKTKDLHEDINTLVNPHFASCKNMHQTKAFSNSALSTVDLQSVPPELNSLIEQQEEYIQQLQQESHFCRNQLNNLLHKVREVIAENEALHYRNKTGFFKCALDDYTHSNEDVNEDIKQKSIQTKITEIKKSKTLEGPNIVFESRISELEAQLTQAKLELRKAQEENQSNLKRLSASCLNNDVSEMKVQLEKALHARHEAEMEIVDLQKSLTLVRDKETKAMQKAKQTIDAMQQVEFEKNQCETEIKKLKEELDRQHEKLREATQETSKRITEERQQTERRYSQQVEQLSADIASHWDAANKSQLESEKQRKELMELKKELSQKQTFIDNLKKELQSKISNLQSKLNQVSTEKDVAQQEVLAIKLAAERSERQNRQEQSRLQIEVNSYKQRLERTEADLVHLRRENLRLSEQIASLEKEINAGKPTRPENFSIETLPKSEDDKELASMIMDMETKHAATVTGLEDALNNQAMLVSQLTVECQSLTQRLEANNLKHKEEMANLQSNIEYLSNKIQSTLSNQQGVIPIENKDESLVSYSHNASPNSLIQAQSDTFPVTVNQEYSMKTNELNQQNNKSLENDFCHEKVYDTKNKTENAVDNIMQKYEGKNQEDEHKNLIDSQNLEPYMTEQQCNSYEECNVIQSNLQEHIDAKQTSNEMAHNLSQYTTLEMHQNNPNIINSNNEFTQ